MGQTASTHSPTPVGRLAPSPTGLLHLGHARTFLLAWWHIRSRGGRVLMRIEDLDGARVKPGLADAALRDLEWLGLDWDGEVLVQSTGLEQRGLVYACICSRADIRTLQSAPQQGVSETRYPGTCRGRFSSLAQAEQLSGREAGLRFAVPPGEVTIVDGFAPPLVCDVQQQVGDFLVARRDKSPAYQLSVVVDDAYQGVTEVFRGEDLLPSTARQWHLQRALGLGHPRWLHVPLVLDVTGRRLAKRADDLALARLRGGGTDPRAIVAWAAHSSGQVCPERVTASELAAEFRLSAVPHRPVCLSPAQVAALAAARG
jgi:glutamyl-tRNA synthetase